jgi:hypothetical protein
MAETLCYSVHTIMRQTYGVDLGYNLWISAQKIYSPHNDIFYRHVQDVKFEMIKQRKK